MAVACGLFSIFHRFNVIGSANSVA